MKDNKNSLNVAKIGMVGDSQVGKTSICYTFIGVEFSTESQQTIGAEKFDKKIILKNKKEVKIVLWDTAGGNRFRSAVFRIIKNVQGIILVFDFRKRESFENINLWLKQVNEELDNPFFILFGNKSDGDKINWEITAEEVNKFAKEKEIHFFKFLQ